MPRVLFLQYTNPAAYPPLIRSSRLLADAGCEVLFAGAESQHVRTLALPPHSGIRVKLLPAAGEGWQLKLHYLWFCLWALIQAVRFRPQWVYASDIMSAPPALVMAVVLRRRVVFHEHDTYEAAAPSLFMRVVIAAFERLARRADVNVLPNDGRLSHFRRRTGAAAERCVRVWNCPSANDVRTARKPAASNGLRLLFHGAIVASRVPVVLLDALVRLPAGVSLRIVGYEQKGGGYISRLSQEAAIRRLGRRLELLGPVSHAELMAMAEDCDLGLACMPRAEDANMRAMAGASNKAFEYLACGLPVLVSPLPDWEAMFVQPGYARCCDVGDVESVVAAVLTFLNDPEGMRAMGERGRQRILADWNYETQFAPVLQRIVG
jgi:glycosyltransferase involved in cell wall biosynthesis